MQMSRSFRAGDMLIGRSRIMFSVSQDNKDSDSVALCFGQTDTFRNAKHGVTGPTEDLNPQH